MMNFKKNINSFVINLSYRKDRLENFDKQMKKLDIPYVVFRAKTDNDGLKMYGIPKGAMGCAASHCRIIEEQYKKGSGNYLCIFEDDAVFCTDFMERFNYLNLYIHKYNWDIIYLSAYHHLPENTPKASCNKDSRYYDKKKKTMNTFSFTEDKYIHKMHASFIMVGYIIHPNKVEKVYKFLINEISKPNKKKWRKSRAIDQIFMNMMEEDKVNVYSFVPGMITQMESMSDIAKKNRNLKDYFLRQEICGKHTFVDKLEDFNYDEYFIEKKQNNCLFLKKILKFFTGSETDSLSIEEIEKELKSVIVIDNKNVQLSPKLTPGDVYNLKEGQKKILNMMKIFHCICEKHNIRYFLIGGSALGAVVYRGWIPWDGDFDVEIFAEDYKKFQQVIQTELPEGLWFQDSETDKYYTNRRIIGKIRDLNSCYIEYCKKGNTQWHNGLQIDINKFHFKDHRLIMPDNPKINFLKYDDVFPLRKMKFEDAEFFLMNNSVKYIKRKYGKTWNKNLPLKLRKPHEGLVDPFNTCEFHYEKYPELYQQ